MKMNEYYEVIMVLKSDANDAHNPLFIFNAKHEAMNLVDVLVSQGYEVLIVVKEEEL